MEVFDKKTFSSMNNNNNKQEGKGKGILIGIVVCVILIILLAVMVLVFRDIDSKTFKIYVNDQRVSCSSDFYLEYEGYTYVKANEFASMVGLTYQNGAYGDISEDSSAGYFNNDYEASSIEADSYIVKKYIDVIETTDEEEESSDEEEETIEITVYSENGALESVTLGLPVIYENNYLYIPFDYINDICNCTGSYQDYRMYVYNMEYLENLALVNAGNFGYTSVSGTYENLRALAYNMLVVINNSGSYGVVNLSTGEQILGFKYSDIVFNQGSKEFLIRLKSDDTLGIVSADGDVIISPNYDSITTISDELGLYLVEKNSQYGVLNRDGDTIVYTDYDSIGLSDEAVYVFDYEENDKYVLYDSLIVAESDGKYGFYNLYGDVALSVNFQGLGYINSSDEEIYEKYVDSLSDSSSNSSDSSSSSSSSNSTTSGDSVLLIDVEFELDDGQIGCVQGIVVEQSTGYGLYDAVQEKLIIPCGCTRIYSTTKSGETTYYMEFNGEQIEFIDYVIQNELYTIKEIENIVEDADVE